ncbi:glycoside hydrolase family 92 protein [Mucilaginibacter limnophilus]|uniref:Glycoside hydrolase family 92 protein n=1 Tax=Mucilaginibacter limnophilus TaxID=1932778 RepID=A0A437MZ60_9SPHI|nr:GH92 family glycosyl hydrolase [Mucilaginibacter limnophilus]RVU02906.1 glycoside hydrolase family 92 protein [Mucilaginibacter limnophilus]
MKSLSKLSCLLFLGLASHTASAQKLTSFVDPFIGTGGHGHTYPGATVPFGMVQLSPDNGRNGWDWSSGYHYSDTAIVGFSHTHLSGTGIGDWCDILTVPLVTHKADTGVTRFGFSHANETAKPGYYKVKLNNGIIAELTATERCGYHKYTFPAGSLPAIKFDLGFFINSDKPVEGCIHKVNDSTIVGYRYSTGWANKQGVYFAARTSVPFKQLLLSADKKQHQAGTETKAEYVGAQLLFEKAGVVLLKVGLSSVNEEKALAAIGEIGNYSFNQIYTAADSKWEKELQKIKITSADDDAKKIFYTALYHTCMAPVLYSDVDGAYQNAKGEFIKGSGQRYTVYSLWDTFRALNPLFTLIQPERNTDILNSIMAFYNENGALPVWDLSTNETNTMVGYHAIPVLADAILKGVTTIDAQKAYAAMRKSAFQNVRGTPDYIKYGYIPKEKLTQSASVTIEYAYDDWCIAQVAKKLGYMDDYLLFSKRAMSYLNLFDKTTGFIRGKHADGKWVEPFDPFHSEHDGANSVYTEGNAWQHSFFAPHDVRGLAKAHGSNEALLKKLDQLFNASSEVTGENVSMDISGLIGQYVHGNEPSHHIAYMYTFLGQPWKTQQRVRQIVDSLYTAKPDGYAGNEDCGQMSAWAVWSMVGLYPANPAGGEYVIGSPAINNAVIQLPGNKTLKINAVNNSKKNIYVAAVKWNGKPYPLTYFKHDKLLQGGTIEFIMSSIPVKTWGIKPSSWPYSATDIK